MVSLRRPTEVFYFYSLIALFMCYVNNLFACIMDFVSVTDVVIIEYFRA